MTKIYMHYVNKAWFKIYRTIWVQHTTHYTFNRTIWVQHTKVLQHTFNRTIWVQHTTFSPNALNSY